MAATAECQTFWFSAKAQKLSPRPLGPAHAPQARNLLYTDLYVLNVHAVIGQITAHRPVRLKRPHGRTRQKTAVRDGTASACCGVLH